MNRVTKPKIATNAEPAAFPSLAFPADRRVLTVKEVAQRFGCSEQHVIDLLEEGLIDGFDITAPHDSVRVPRVWLEQLARRLGLPLKSLQDEVAALRQAHRSERAHWRIPVEGYQGYLERNAGSQRG